jgi:ABC-type dipeptide/oligopeptide/nickel transport system permease component
MLMLAFSVYLGWLPTTGRGDFSHIILPAVTLGAASTAVIARMTRSGMLEVMQQDYIRTARSKGLKEQVVLSKHALKNALIPVVTMIGLQFGVLLGGAVLTETIFAWPGVGRLLVDAIFWRDYPLVQGAVLLIATAFIIINLIVDILYSFLDPRIRYN